MQKVYLFQLVAFKIYAIIKTVYGFNWLSWTPTGSSYWEAFLEINLNQKTLKFYTSWKHWKNQCRSTVRKHARLWNKNEYQHITDIFLKNIFNPFHGLFYTSWNTSEKQRFLDVFRAHWKIPVPWNGLRVI